FTAQQNMPMARPKTEWIKMDFSDNFLIHFLAELHRRKIGMVLVEGGAKLLQSFIQANLWDEARVITSSKNIGEGVKAPLLPTNPSLIQRIDTDELAVYYPA
ncbi:MAG: riboflavin biosynthesis protein RibD, partial [Saprospiraceae bacterium]|nr:riboflavin biosynthesis protein RibD [Saprospiraceae bacterium]